MKKISIIIVASVAFLNLQAQHTFQKALIYFGDQTILSICSDGSGGFVGVGYDFPGSILDSDISMMHVNSEGHVQWYKEFGSSYQDYAFQIEKCSDNGYIISGYTKGFGFGQSDGIVIKTDVNGNPEWSHVYGGTGYDGIYCSRQTPDGGFIMAGEESSISSGNVLLIKTNTQGSLQWSKTYGGSLGDGASNLIITNDGGFLMGGRANLSQTEEDILLIKTDSLGNIQWSRYYGNSEKNELFPGGNSIIKVSGGGYLVLGYTFANNNWDGLLLRLDANGDTLWTKTYVGPGSEFFRSIVPAWNGGYILAGNTNSYNPTSNISVMNIDTSGEIIWSNMYGDYNGEFDYTILPSDDMGYFIAGGSRSITHGNFEPLFIKIDTTGYTPCNSEAVTFPTSHLALTGSSIPEVASLNNDSLISILTLTLSYDTLTLCYECFQLSISSVDATGQFNCDGEATANPSGGQTPYSYSWSNGATTQVNSNLCVSTYYVTVTDNSGCTSVNLIDIGYTTGIDHSTLDNKIDIYPNPSEGEFTISGLSDLSGRIEVRDISGRVVKRLKDFTSPEFVVDLRNYSAGMYFVIIYTNGTSFRHKVVIR